MILDYLETLHELETVHEVWDFHLGQMAQFGFDRALYAFTRHRTDKSYGSHQDMLILTNHDPCYVEAFIDGGMFQDAPMVKWAADNVGACSWSHLMRSQGEFTKREREIFEYNHKMGIIAGVSIGFRQTSSRAKGGIGLVARLGISQDEVDVIWQTHGREIVQMNNAAHVTMTGLPYPTRRRPLTTRQREALEWVSDGKTTQDVATIMGLTTATVEKHLRLARQTLEVDTTAQAVLKASHQNQFFVIAAEPA